MRLLAFLPVVAATPLWSGFNPSNWAFESAEAVLREDNEATIWQQLQDDDKYSKLVKILKWEKDTIKELEKSSDHGITFFAVNNDGLTRHHDKDKEEMLPVDETLDDDWEAITLTMDFVEGELDSYPPILDLYDELDNKDEKKGEKRRRKILKKIAHAVLQYHILPHDHSALSLAKNSTVATQLHPHDGSSGGMARRIHLQKQLLPPALKVNFYATVQSSSEAKNGHLHELDHPLLPPPSIFEGMFHASRHVSTTTSALQRVGGRDYCDWRYDHKKSKPGKPVFSGTPLATVFAPTNDAWNSLPPRLHMWLFSRFGAHALAKLLAYHYVPHTLVLSEVVHHEKHKHKKITATTIDDDDDPSFHCEFEVHSGLGPKANLKIVVDKTQVLPVEGATKVTIKVNGVEAKIIDIPSSNGGWHMLDKVLCPPHEHKKPKDDKLAAQEAADGEWAGWESWLPDWSFTYQVEGLGFALE